MHSSGASGTQEGLQNHPKERSGAKSFYVFLFETETLKTPERTESWPPAGYLWIVSAEPEGQSVHQQERANQILWDSL